MIKNAELGGKTIDSQSGTRQVGLAASETAVNIIECIYFCRTMKREKEPKKQKTLCCSPNLQHQYEGHISHINAFCLPSFQPH